MSIESVVPSNRLIVCRPLLPPSIFPSIRVFSNESVLRIMWPKYWSFSFSISPFNEYSGLISFRTDWFDLLAIQGTLKSLLQHHSPKASILQCLVFFIVQLSHPYMTTGKTIALTRWTFVGKVCTTAPKLLATQSCHGHSNPLPGPPPHLSPLPATTPCQAPAMAVLPPIWPSSPRSFPSSQHCTSPLASHVKLPLPGLHPRPPQPLLLAYTSVHDC